MKLHGLAAILATLILAASPSIADPSRTSGGAVAFGAAAPAESTQPGADAVDEKADGPGYEEGYTGSWFPTVKPESEPSDLEDSDTVPPVDRPDIPPVPLDAQYSVERGDTFKAVLLRAGVVPEEADRAIQALAKVYDPRRLRPGIEVFLQLQPQKKNRPPFLLSIDFVADPETDVSVLRESDGSYTATTYERSLAPRLAYGRATITSSLYEAGQDAGISSAVLSSLVNLYSFDVDFQRDVQPGDSFEILYQRMTDESGTPVMDGNIVLASMTLSGVKTMLYRFKTKSGYADYFDPEGQSVQKSLMRTPTDAARISSGFGRRKHPILGFTLMHRGIDFAAPPGTPIYAAGDGLIEKAGWAGSYGKYIRIRHNGNYKTAYAHLRGFASGIAEGVRVKQRQVIGYVGSTGRATGPHLHYEVIKDGAQINPQSLRLASGYKLKDQELQAYKEDIAKLAAQLDTFRERMAHREN
jgi:murein DD-endopeptidase MepM/ murein hydrolase activator NlpD